MSFPKASLRYETNYYYCTGTAEKTAAADAAHHKLFPGFRCAAAARTALAVPPHPQRLPQLRELHPLLGTPANSNTLYASPNSSAPRHLHPSLSPAHARVVLQTFAAELSTAGATVPACRSMWNYPRLPSCTRRAAACSALAPTHPPLLDLGELQTEEAAALAKSPKEQLLLLYWNC